MIMGISFLILATRAMDLVNFFSPHPCILINITITSVQQLLILDLEGNFIEKHKINGDALNEVLALNDSVLLFTSFIDYQLLYYNTRSKKEIAKALKYEVFLHHFIPYFNTYTFNNSTFTVPAITNDIKKVTEINHEHYYSYNFGKLNNSINQINTLHNELKFQDIGENARLHSSIGINKKLNHLIIKIFESNRFRLALVGIEEGIKHVLVDKFSRESFVFNHFNEGVFINMYFNVHQDKYLIAHEFRDFKDINKAMEFFGSWFPYYSGDYYSNDFLDISSKKIIDAHDPMKDNPFLVVYKFKE
jgi:hypothetical protein